MNWIKENKFLTGLLAVLVIGIGVLGWLLLSAKGKYDDATGEYEKQSAERARLHNLVPYPSQENVQELQAQKTEAGQKITDLQRSLAATELPIEPLTPVQFQDKLRLAVTEVRTLAGSEMKLGGAEKSDKFFLAFDKYETTPPDPAAAGPLGRELKAIQWLVTKFIQAKVLEIRSLQRDPLPEELGKTRGREEKPAAPAPKGGKTEAPAAPLVQAHGITLVVFGDPAAMRKVLNEIVASKEQFYIPRGIAFKNEKDKVQRIDLAVTAPPPDPTAPAGATPAPAAPPAPPSTYIVGEEHVEMTLHLELVDFSEPGAK